MQDSKNWNLAVAAMRKHSMTVSVVKRLTLLNSRQRMITNLTLVDWLLVSGGILFDVNWESEDDVETEILSK